MANTFMEGEETYTNTHSLSQVVPQKPKLTQVSVKCPQFYKDSVARDIIDCYCPHLGDKAAIICPTSEIAQSLFGSEYLNSISILIHNGFDRRDRVKNGRLFEDKTEYKCLITNNISTTHVRNLKVRLIIFISPPQNSWIYTEAVDLAQKLEYAAVCYSTAQIKPMCDLQNRLQRKFMMLVPPEVESDEQQPSQSVQQAPGRCERQLNTANQHQKYQIIVKNIQFQVGWKKLKQTLQMNGVYTIDVRMHPYKRQKNSNISKTATVICCDKNSYEAALKLSEVSIRGKKIEIHEDKALKSDKESIQMVKY